VILFAMSLKFAHGSARLGMTLGHVPLAGGGSSSKQLGKRDSDAAWGLPGRLKRPSKKRPGSSGNETACSMPEWVCSAYRFAVGVYGFQMEVLQQRGWWKTLKKAVKWTRKKTDQEAVNKFAP
jgi:hypothetical protein